MKNVTLLMCGFVTGFCIFFSAATVVKNDSAYDACVKNNGQSCFSIVKG